MSTKVIGLIQLTDPAAFEIYRSQVGATVEQYGGQIAFRGEVTENFWNELGRQPGIPGACPHSQPGHAPDAFCR